LLAVAVFAVSIWRFCTAAGESCLRPPKGAQVAIVVFGTCSVPIAAGLRRWSKKPRGPTRFPWCATISPCHFTPGRTNAAIDARLFRYPLESAGATNSGLHFFQPVGSDSAEPARLHGKFAAEHKIDCLRGRSRWQTRRLGQCRQGTRQGDQLQHATLYVVSNKRSGKPFVEVVDRSQLYALIDAMMKD